MATGGENEICRHYPRENGHIRSCWIERRPHPVTMSFLERWEVEDLRHRAEEMAVWRRQEQRAAAIRRGWALSEFGMQLPLLGRKPNKKSDFCHQLGP